MVVTDNLCTFYEKWALWGSKMSLGTFDTLLMQAYQNASETNRIGLRIAFPSRFVEKIFNKEYRMVCGNNTIDFVVVTSSPYIEYMRLSQMERLVLLTKKPVLHVFVAYERGDEETQKRLMAAFPHLFESCEIQKSLDILDKV